MANNSSRPHGTCKLCGAIGPLENSHLIPQFAYRAVGNSESRASNSLTTETSRKYQHTDYLLCANCEQKFSNLETELGGLIRRPEQNRFPLLRYTSGSIEGAVEGNSTVWHTKDSPNISHEIIAKFALSVIWRAAVHTWRNFDGSYMTRPSLGTYEPDIRAYLLGGVSFPDSNAVQITLLADQSRIALSRPTKARSGNFYRHEFELCGIRFTVSVGKSIPARDRYRCIVRGDRNPIVVTGGSDVLASSSAARESMPSRLARVDEVN